MGERKEGNGSVVEVWWKSEEEKKRKGNEI